ncbi:MAG: polysaccharide biosynthesis C-terminal domain-containing protein [Bacteroidales bacterium]|nr:polysaccharide biosynthesis C-terminal domain-containing protein [Bacteroidales bacterium]
MGIIQKQSITGTIYSGLGVVIGFVTTALLFPRFLTTDEIGLLKLLVSFSVIFAQFGSLGFQSAINRLFPYFRNKEKNHSGFIAFAFLVSLAGFILSSAAFEIYKPVLIRNNIENSALLIEYIYLIIPLIFATLFFNLFDTYNKVLYDTVLGTFLKEFLQRLLIFASLLLYYFNSIDLQSFVIAYAVSLSVPTIVLLLVLMVRGEIGFTIKKEAFTKDIIREMSVISLFGVIAGLGGLAIVHIDSLMVNKFLGISMTGIYATTFFFATLILIPSRPLLKISTPIIAESWKANDLDNIKLVYSKSCINQSVIGILVFIGLWANIDNIFLILPKEFEAGKYVILFIGIANIIEMASGVSGIILSTSVYYRYSSILIFFFLLFIIGLNYIFIPLFGLVGAAIATTLAKILYMGLRFIFLQHHYKMQPYNFKFILLIIIGLLAYYGAYALPVFKNYILDIFIRSSVVLVIYSILIIVFRISEDINKIYSTLFKKYVSRGN